MSDFLWETTQFPTGKSKRGRLNTKKTKSAAALIRFSRNASLAFSSNLTSPACNFKEPQNVNCKFFEKEFLKPGTE